MRPQPTLLQCMVRLGCSAWRRGFGGFQAGGTTCKVFWESPNHCNRLPHLQALAHPAETWEMAVRGSSKLLQHLHRVGFAEATQHPLHPSLHPSMCTLPWPGRCTSCQQHHLCFPPGFLALNPPSGDMLNPTCSSGPWGALPVMWCREKVRSRVSSRTVLAANMVAARGLFLRPASCYLALCLCLWLSPRRNLTSACHPL